MVLPFAQLARRATRALQAPRLPHQAALAARKSALVVPVFCRVASLHVQPCVASHDVSTVIFVCPYGCAGRASTATRGTLRAPIARLVMLAHLLRNRQIRSTTCVRKCQPSVGPSKVGTYPTLSCALLRHCFLQGGHVLSCRSYVVQPLCGWVQLPSGVHVCYPSLCHLSRGEVLASWSHWYVCQRL